MIVAVPAVVPVITPVVLPMVAMAGLLLVHIPPTVALVRVVVCPLHTAPAPVIAPGVALTVMLFVAVQPVVGIVYVMVAVPAVMPLTSPVGFTVAMVVAELLHDPPVLGLVSSVVVAVHRLLLPLIVPGEGVTVIAFVTVQPVPKEYVMVVVPAETPVTTPDSEPILAAVLLLSHQPPGTISVSVVLAPVHTVDAPLMGAGAGLTVTIFMVWQPVGSV